MSKQLNIQLQFDNPAEAASYLAAIAQVAEDEGHDDIAGAVSQADSIDDDDDDDDDDYKNPEGYQQGFDDGFKAGYEDVAAVAGVPEGYEILPAGITRKLRVSSDFIQYGGRYGTKAFLVYEGDSHDGKPYAEVSVLGPSRFVWTTEPGIHCGKEISNKSGTAWLETQAALAVKK